MKRLGPMFQNLSLENVCHFLGTGLCLLTAKIAPFLAVIALFYQIRMLRAKAKTEELRYTKECEVCKRTKNEKV